MRPSVYIVDFACLMCGRAICDVLVANPRTAIWLSAAVRCGVCGGSPVRSGEVRRRDTRRQPLPPEDWETHVGRPTKAIAAARRAALGAS